MKNFFIIWTIIFGVLVSACNSKIKNGSSENPNSENPAFTVNSNLKNVNLRKQNFTVDVSKGENIRTSDGVRILIPAEIFVDASGNPVTGKVDVSYTGLNSIEEIVASGIPMQAKNGNEIGQFVSDGMFKINASSGGNQVYVAKGKSIQVYTPVKDESSNFRNWYFDEKKGSWTDLGPRTNTVSEESITSAAQNFGIHPYSGITLENLKWFKNPGSVFQFAANESPQIEIAPSKIIPGKYNPSKMTLDIQFDENLYPDLAIYSSLMWQYAGTSAEMDPAKNNWIFQSRWSNVDLKPRKDNSGIFDLIIETNGKKFKTVVRPVVSGSDYEKASKDYNKEVEKLKKMQEEIAEQGTSQSTIQKNMYTAFSVSQLGTYNCDKFYNDPNARNYTVNFNYDGKNLQDGHTVYTLINGRTSVIQYSANRTMRINPDVVDAIFTVAANGVIASVSTTELTRMKRSSGGEMGLNMEKVKTKITNLFSLKQALSEI